MLWNLEGVLDREGHRAKRRGLGSPLFDQHVSRPALLVQRVDQREVEARKPGGLVELLAGDEHHSAFVQLEGVARALVLELFQLHERPCADVVDGGGVAPERRLEPLCPLPLLRRVLPHVAPDPEPDRRAHDQPECGDDCPRRVRGEQRQEPQDQHDARGYHRHTRRCPTAASLRCTHFGLDDPALRLRQRAPGCIQGGHA